MTELKVDTITDAAGTGKPDFEDSITIDGATLANTNTAEYNSSGTEPTSPQNGSIWWDSTNEKVYIYANSEFKEITLEGDDTVESIAFGGERGLFAGGYTGSARSDVIDYVALSTAGNATDFGNLTVARQGLSATASTSRSVFALGYTGSVYSNVLDYVSPATTGNATDFGDYNISGAYNSSKGTVSDGTTGLFGGAYTTARIDSISKITIATTGNATDYGDLSVAREYPAAGCDNTRGVFMGGRNTTPANSNVIDYVTIGTDGNATDFGDLITATRESMGASDITYALSFGGVGDQTAIEYVTIQTTGNATDFGNLTSNRFDGGANSNGTIAGISGYTTGYVNTIDQVTIATPANATDFGDLSVARAKQVATSGAAA